MIARIQQSGTLALLIFAAGWAAFFTYRDSYALAAAGALLTLFGYGFYLAAEFGLLLLFGADGANERPARSQLLRAWGGEFLCAPLVFCWRQPFRSRAEPDFVLPTVRGQRGVVLVHGFFCNRGLWNPWMRALRARGIPFVAVNLEPPFASIDDYARIIEVAAARIEAATGETPVIVAHSMGGLAVRGWLARFDAVKRIHRVVTIASPHRGTWLARFGHTRNATQMRQASTWLCGLGKLECAQGPARFICYYGNCDNIVFPASSAMLTGADNRHLDATAHVQMVYHPDVLKAVLEWLEPAKPPLEPRTAPFS
jgi:triacylglycerol lipase